MSVSMESVSMESASLEMVTNTISIPNSRFQIGDTVSIRIPQADHTCTGMPRIPCVIVEVHGKVQESYRLR